MDHIIFLITDSRVLNEDLPTCNLPQQTHPAPHRASFRAILQEANPRETPLWQPSTRRMFSDCALQVTTSSEVRGIQSESKLKKPK